MPKTVRPKCGISGCPKPHHAHGYCNSHMPRPGRKGVQQCSEPTCPTSAIKLGYCRRHEALALARLPTTVLAELLEQIALLITPDPNTGCWLWNGSVDDNGYSHCFVGRSDWLVHRLMYVLFIGTHLQSRQLDHLCGGPSGDGPEGSDKLRRRCVNPRHLEPVTARVNILRRDRRARHPGAAFWTDADDRGKTSIALMLWADAHGLPGAVPGNWEIHTDASSHI